MHRTEHDRHSSKAHSVAVVLGSAWTGFLDTVFGRSLKSTLRKQEAIPKVWLRLGAFRVVKTLIMP